MNKIVLLGRLVKDPELRYVEGGESIYKIHNCCGKKF